MLCGYSDLLNLVVFRIGGFWVVGFALGFARLEWVCSMVGLCLVMVAALGVLLLMMWVLECCGLGFVNCFIRFLCLPCFLIV